MTEDIKEKTQWSVNTRGDFLGLEWYSSEVGPTKFKKISMKDKEWVEEKGRGGKQ